IAGHRRCDLRVVRLRRRREQRSRCHQLTSLTVPTLRDVELLPCLLKRMQTVRRQPFDRGDGRTCGGRYWCLTGALRASAHVYRARAALADAAAELGALQVHDVPEDPEQ